MCHRDPRIRAPPRETRGFARPSRGARKLLLPLPDPRLSNREEDTSTMRHAHRLAPILLAALLLGSPPRSAEAGCGCDKPPPSLAAIRPNVTWAGEPVSLFSSTFTVGTAYTVTFTS